MSFAAEVSGKDAGRAGQAWFSLLIESKGSHHMMIKEGRTERYSWRVSSELKSDLEREARLRKISISSVLDSAVRAWLKKSAVGPAEDEEQRRLHRAAASSLGILAGRDSHRAENARQSIRQRLDRRYAR
jgi:hypothetical protein